MSRLARKIAKVFGVSAPTGKVARFGSIAAGSKVSTIDPDSIQSLSKWGEGWTAAVVGNVSPTIEDFNALHLVHSYQSAYMLQHGIPEWHAETDYHKGSIAKDATGEVYLSLIDDNIGIPLTTIGSWKILIPKPLNPQASPVAALRAMSNYDVGSVQSGNWIGISYSPDLKMFVSIDGSKISTSIDGKTWVTRTRPGSPYAGGDVRAHWIADQRKFLIMNNAGSFVSSSDGATYAGQASTFTVAPPSGSGVDYCFSRELGLYVMIFQDTPSNTGAAANVIQTSTDSIAWTNRPIAAIPAGGMSHNWKKVEWCAGFGLFIAIGGISGPGQKPPVLSSPDGFNWTYVTMPAGSADMIVNAMKYSRDQNMLVCVGSNGASLYTYDGVNFVFNAMPEPNTYQGIDQSPELGYWMATCSNGTSRLAISKNGFTWTAKLTPTQWPLGPISYGAGLGVFTSMPNIGAVISLSTKYVQKFIAP